MALRINNTLIAKWNNTVITKWNNMGSGVVLSATITNSSYNGYGVACNAGSNGTITVSAVSGGTGTGFQVKLNSGGTYAAWGNPTVFSSLSSASYTVYVKDSANNETTFPTTLTAPAAQTLSITNPVNTSGGASNGSLTISTAGGVFNKTYYLYRDISSPYEPGGGSLYATYSNITAGSPYVNVSSLPGGGYYFTSTDANGCSTTSSVTVLT